MNLNFSNRAKRYGVPLLAALLVACGGGGSAIVTGGIGGTGIVFGMITGFGSVYVNGTRYLTDDSEFEVDGELAAGQADLSVGMVVRLEVKLDENGMLTDRATRVIYDDEVQGPVEAAPQPVAGSGGTQLTFAVFGQTVTIDETTTVFDGVTFDTLAAGDVIEVSGFRGSATAIVGSYVKKRGTLATGFDEVELRGTVNCVTCGPTAGEFTLGGVLVKYDTSTVIEVDGGLTNGKFVEVEGRYNIGPPEFITAEEIETEDEGFDDDVEISLQGVISDWVDIDSEFKVNGFPVDASDPNLELTPANAVDLLDNGVNVEVEGAIVGGVLIADELELREGRVRLDAEIATIGPGDRFTVKYGSLGLLGTITVLVDGQTAFEDDTAAANPGFANLVPGNFVKIEGREETNDEVYAGKVKRDEADELRLRGAVDDFDEIAESSITVLGIAYSVDASTKFEQGEIEILRSDFFAALQIGAEVEIKDDDGDGVADEVELKD